MTRKFENYFEPYKHRFPRMVITETTNIKIRKFASDLIEVKKTESHHIKDNQSEQKRWFTGISGELALEKFLNVEFFDWSIGNSKTYNVPDLKQIGLNVGIKTVEYGKFPIIHLNPYRPEIIIVKDRLRYYICGLATVNVQREFSDISLILDKNLRERNVKTGFYGFDKLVQFKSLEELKRIIA